MISSLTLFMALLAPVASLGIVYLIVRLIPSRTKFESYLSYSK